MIVCHFKCFPSGVVNFRIFIFCLIINCYIFCFYKILILIELFEDLNEKISKVVLISPHVIRNYKLKVFFLFIFRDSVIDVPFHFFEILIVSLVSFNVPDKHLVEIFGLTHWVSDNSIIHFIVDVVLVPLSTQVVCSKMIHKELELTKISINDGNQ